MKLRMLFLSGMLCSLAPLSLSAAHMRAPSQQDHSHPAGPKIRVLLEKDVPSAYLEAKGSYKVIRRDNGAMLSHGGVGKRFVVHALQDGLRWGEEYPDVYQVTLIPTSPSTFFYVNGMQYKGAISIYHVRDNHITVVNEISIEDFLKSTLAIRFEQSLPKEALSAMAIAARTEIYRKMLGSKSSARPWDIAANDVEYFGFGVSVRGNGVEEAVDWSRFMVMESIKPDEYANTINIVTSRAEDLAKQGCDARQILKSVFPHAKIASTIDANEVALR